MKILITGGAGFIGSNAASRYLMAGHKVVVIDNLCREGTPKNLAALQTLGGQLEFMRLDLRDAIAVNAAFEKHRDADRILHLAAQVAVTTSVLDPRHDFEVNALGSLNVLEAIRRFGIEAPAIYSSTNKVYGDMKDVRVVLRDNRYAYADFPNGMPESRNLDFHSPYGCSKGVADQYFLDYHRIYGLNTMVFRQSCIYGYRQFGAEDQGWLAWFIIASQLNHPLTIFGDGRQVRDVLFIDDLLDAYDAGFAAFPAGAGRAYNIGGGAGNILSLLDLISYIEKMQGRKISYSVRNWRAGDQRVFVSDIRRARNELGWSPRIGYKTGLSRLYDWVASNLHLFEDEPSHLQLAAVSQ